MWQIDYDETNFLMEGSRRKEPRRGSESMVDEMLFKSWPSNYWKGVKYLSSFSMNTKSPCQRAKTTVTKQTFSTASRTPFLLAAENKAAAYLPWKIHKLLLTWYKVTNLDTINRDRCLDNSVPGHSCAEVSGQDGKVSPSHHLLWKVITGSPTLIIHFSHSIGNTLLMDG